MRNSLNYAASENVYITAIDKYGGAMHIFPGILLRWIYSSFVVVWFIERYKLSIATTATASTFQIGRIHLKVNPSRIKCNPIESWLYFDTQELFAILLCVVFFLSWCAIKWLFAFGKYLSFGKVFIRWLFCTLSFDTLFSTTCCTYYINIVFYFHFIYFLLFLFYFYVSTLSLAFNLLLSSEHTVHEFIGCSPNIFTTTTTVTIILLTIHILSNVDYKYVHSAMDINFTLNILPSFKLNKLVLIAEIRKKTTIKSFY